MKELKEVDVAKLLVKLGVYSNTIAYSYLVEVICVTVKNPEYSKSLAKTSFNIIAKRYNVSELSVEKGIRSVINSKKIITDDEELIYEVFYLSPEIVSKGITPVRFISGIVSYFVRRNLE